MLVRAIEAYVPYVGPKGALKEIPAAQAKVLIALHKVEEVSHEPVAPPWDDDGDQEVDVAIAAAPEPPPQTYQRRDMAAEPITKPAARRRGRPKKTDVPPTSDQ